MDNWAIEVSRSIREGMWLSIQYKNRDEKTSFFWCAIKDINPDNKNMLVDEYNHNKGNEILKDCYINFDRIVSASVVDGTTYPIQETLIRKISENYSKFKFLEYISINERVLGYYQECYSLDNDPFHNECFLVPEIDDQTFIDGELQLNEEKFSHVVSMLLKMNGKASTKRKTKFERFIFNYLAVSSSKKGVVPIVFYEAMLDIGQKKFVIKKEYQFNSRSVLVNDEAKFHIENYLDCSLDYFKANFALNEHEFIDQIQDNLGSHELIDQRPYFMRMIATYPIAIRDEYQAISNKYREDKLTYPLKSFFGLIDRERLRRKPKSILIDGENKNIDQLRVIYNAINRNMSFVQGPPGTGKTVSIVNILHSCLLNRQTVLVASNNNEAINNIIRKLQKLEFNGVRIKYPFIRLGSMQAIGDSLDDLSSYFVYAEKQKIDAEIHTRMKEIEEKIFGYMAGITEVIDNYEKQKITQEKLESLKSLVKTYEDMIDVDENTKQMMIIGIEAQIIELHSQLPSPLIEDTQIAVFDVEQNIVREYLYLSSLIWSNNIFKKRNSRFYEIVKMPKGEEKSIEFRNLIGTDEGMEQLLDCFPIVFSTNISAGKIGAKNPIFDLLIMEEASQCNCAISLIPMSRCKRACFIGDQNQLRPVITISDEKNNRLRSVYDISDYYDYKENSILTTLLNTDGVSPFVLLKKHYRCAKKIIDFSNQKYYGGELVIDEKLNQGNPLTLIGVKNSSAALDRNTSMTEAYAVVEELKRSDLSKDIAVITPFKNQEKLIKTVLASNGFPDIKVGTIHTFQGDERDKIIVSTAITGKTTQGAFDWVKNNSELINVMTTRPKENLVVIADVERVHEMSKGDMNDYSELLTYMSLSGNANVVYHTNELFESRTKNYKYFDTQAERDFLDTIMHFRSTNQQFIVKSKPKVTDVLEVDKYDIVLFGYANKAHFDFVLYDLQNRPLMAIEVWGIEHYTQDDVKNRDKLKKEICEKHDLILIMFDNNYVRRYNQIRDAIMQTLAS